MADQIFDPGSGLWNGAATAVSGSLLTLAGRFLWDRWRHRRSDGLAAKQLDLDARRVGIQERRSSLDELRDVVDLLRQEVVRLKSEQDECHLRAAAAEDLIGALRKEVLALRTEMAQHGIVATVPTGNAD